MDPARVDRADGRRPAKGRGPVQGRIARWRKIPEAEGRILRVVVLPDGETVHNAFFDRNVSL
jgi:hypothetical protein